MSCFELPKWDLFIDSFILFDATQEKVEQKWHTQYKSQSITPTAGIQQKGH